MEEKEKKDEKLTKKAEEKKVKKESTTKETKKASKSETPKKKTAAKKVEKKEVKKEDKKEEVKENKEAKKEIKEFKKAKAILRHERIASSKLNQVAKLIRGKDIEEALAILKFSGKKAGRILTKVLNSAIANAVNNHFMDESKLYVAEVHVMQGATLKRLRARAKGAANRIRKRTSHVEIVLQEREEK